MRFGPAQLSTERGERRAYSGVSCVRKKGNKVRTTLRLLAAISSLVLVGEAYGQTPAATNAASQVKNSCNGGQDAKVKQECLKVAKQMEHSAATGADDSRNSPNPNTVMHSSPVMDTPKEVKEEKQARKEGEAASAKAKANQSSPGTKPIPASPQPKPNSDK
jgi:hypothetical protein